jgi:hypothetical protein
MKMFLALTLESNVAGRGAVGNLEATLAIGTNSAFVNRVHLGCFGIARKRLYG